LVRPNAGLNDPLKPAAVQAARALPTVNPTRFGTTWQAGAAVGVGEGVGDGAGVGSGNGVGVGVDAGGGAVGVGGDAGGGAPVAAATDVDVGAGVGAGVPTPGRSVGVAPGPSGAGPAGAVLPVGAVALTSPTAGVRFRAGDGVAVSNSLASAVTSGCADGKGAPAMRI
jgi:hypothetical protein